RALRLPPRRPRSARPLTRERDEFVRGRCHQLLLAARCSARRRARRGSVAGTSGPTRRIWIASFVAWQSGESSRCDAAMNVATESSFKSAGLALADLHAAAQAAAAAMEVDVRH